MTKKIQFRAFIPANLSAIRTGGDSLRLTFDVPESDLQDAIGLVALRNTPLRITVEVDNSPTATKTKALETGPYGKYWQNLCANGIESHPDLRSVLIELGWLDEDSNTVEEAIREAFNVSSRTFISPDSLERWCDHNNLTSVKTMSRTARAKAEEHVKAS